MILRGRNFPSRLFMDSGGEYNREMQSRKSFDRRQGYGIFNTQDLSFYDYDVEVTSNDKILTLSTCTYRLADDTKLHYPNDYRYVVMAKLLPADAVLEDTVSLTVTKNAPVKPAGE